MQKTTINTGIFWGSFDPPTLAHKVIILKMLDLFQEVLIIVNNNLKKQYFSPVNHRINMLHNMLALGANKYKILIQDDTCNNNYFNLRKTTTGALSVVAGMDAMQIWLKTHAINELANYDSIYIVTRAGYTSIDLAKLTNLPNIFALPIDDNYQHISSTAVRKKLFSGQLNSKLIDLDSNILKYIQQHKLYVTI